MLKKAILVIFSIPLLAANEGVSCTCNDQVNNELSPTGKAVMYGSVGAAIIMTMPASALVALAATTASAATYIIPTTVLGKVSLALTVTQILRPYAFQTTEEKLNELLKENDSKPSQAKAEFIDCLKKNKATSEKNASGRPTVCEEAALFYALMAGNSALNQKIDAFNNGGCYCS